MSVQLTDIVTELTGGRPYCFVVMAYKPTGLFWFYQHLQKLIEKETCLACVRADQVPGAGYDLLEKIHQLIARAAVIVADVSEPSPNVFYEVGYAVATRKPVLITAKRDTDVPTDLKGLEVLIRDDTPSGGEVFDEALLQHIRARVESNLPLLRDMLLPLTPHPSYIVCGPRWPDPDTTRPRSMRTYGDYLGVIGIINAFGAVLGVGSPPELVSGKDVAEQVAEMDANLFLIASPKANDLTERFLEKIQNGKSPKWYFDTDELKGEKNILRIRDSDWTPPSEEPQGSRLQDVGIVVRGPHPNPAFSHRLVLILAGQHSLGTGGACLAATHPKLIADLAAKLPDGIQLDDKHRTFWALVHAWESTRDGHLDPEDVQVLDVGVYE